MSTPRLTKAGLSGISKLICLGTKLAAMGMEREKSTRKIGREIDQALCSDRFDLKYCDRHFGDHMDIFQYVVPELLVSQVISWTN